MLFKGRCNKLNGKLGHTRQTGAVTKLILPPPTMATSHFKGVLSSGGVVGDAGWLVDCGLVGSTVSGPGSPVIAVSSLEVAPGIQRNC